MKRLPSIETEQVCLEVVECDCGFHVGIDATWLDQSQNAAGYEFICPACSTTIPVDKLTDEAD